MARSRYEPVLSAKASLFLISLPKLKQKKLVTLLFKLTEHPSQLGDYSTRDPHGRDIQHLKLRDWIISFWADDAVSELRITEINEL